MQARRPGPEASRKIVTCWRAHTLVQRAQSWGCCRSPRSLWPWGSGRHGWHGTGLGHSALTGYVGCSSFATTMNKQHIFSEFFRSAKSLLIVGQNFGLLIKCLSWDLCCKAKSLQLCLILQPHGLHPSRLLCPWASPGKNTGVACHFLL